jgi:hypothetical protein
MLERTSMDTAAFIGISRMRIGLSCKGSTNPHQRDGRRTMSFARFWRSTALQCRVPVCRAVCDHYLQTRFKAAYAVNHSARMQTVQTLQTLQTRNNATAQALVACDSADTRRRLHSPSTTEMPEREAHRLVI